MKTSPPPRKTINRLHKIRSHYDPVAAEEKLALIRSMRNLRIRSSFDVKRLHEALCFIRAFPDTKAHHRQSNALLQDIASTVHKLTKTERGALSDSGIAGTSVYYVFSFEVASWITHRFTNALSIDWAELEDTSRLDELLELLMEDAEIEYFDSGAVDARQWLACAAAKHACTDLDWLMRQLLDRKALTRFWTASYNAAALPLRCDLNDVNLSKSGNVCQTRTIFERRRPAQRRISFTKREISRSLSNIERASATDGRRLINTAMSSLAVRHRETIHFNHANPKEVYVAEVGRGIVVVVMGLQPDHRFALECTMGYLILSNGVPIGYGGASIVFKQANTGINIFAEYRGVEAAWIWTQVMRVYHCLTGCTRYIVNPYQFGSQNTEALRSGAFWFYYRLGYRPVQPSVRALARTEHQKINNDKTYRSPSSTMRMLATCDMHLTLPGSRTSDLFDEHLIEVASMLATQALSDVDRVSRIGAVEWLAQRVAGDLGLQSMNAWTRQEHRALMRFCPFVAVTEPASWPTKDKRAMVELIRAKGSDHELDYAHRLRQHTRFFTTLKKRCKQALKFHLSTPSTAQTS